MKPYYVCTAAVQFGPHEDLLDAIAIGLQARRAGEIMSSGDGDRPRVIGSDPDYPDGLNEDERAQIARAGLDE